MNLMMKLLLLFIAITCINSYCYSSSDARYCPYPYCCDIYNTCGSYESDCHIYADTRYGECNSSFDAKYCDTYTKCCDIYGDCANSMSDCSIYMDGHCQGNSYTKLNCAECCIGTSKKHYCGTSSECSNARIAGLVILIIIILYYVGIIFFCFYGCFLRYKITEQMHQIAAQSQQIQQAR